MSTAADDFACLKCGNCCTIKGTVRLADGEADAIAVHLGVSVEVCVRDYTELSSDRHALILKDSNDGSCIFLQPDRLCRIDRVKPKQCLGFPSNWNYEGWKKVCSANYAAADNVSTKEEI